MNLYFKNFKCYKTPSEKERQSYFYKPDFSYDLSMLPTESLREELTPFFTHRGNNLTLNSLYVDRSNYLLFADFLSDCYPTLNSILSLNLQEASSRMSAWMVEKGLSPQRKSTTGYLTTHSAIRLLSQAQQFCLPKENHIYFKNLDCYKDIPEEKKLSKKYKPDSYFDLNLLPLAIREEFRTYIKRRGETLSFVSLPSELTAYNHIARFLSQSYPSLATLYGIDCETCLRKFKAWLLKNGYSLSFTHSRIVSRQLETSSHPSIKYLIRLLDYFTADDGQFHFSDDIWRLDRLDFPVKKPETLSILTLNFTNISPEGLRSEMKRCAFIRLKQVSVQTVVSEIHAVNEFVSFLEKVFPETDSFTKLTREIIEEYLIFLNTEDGRRKNYRTELLHLKSALGTIGHLTECYKLEHLFFSSDFPKNTIPVYRFYTGTELKTLNEGFKTLDEQTGRLMILHELMGCRISEILTLQTDCITNHEGGGDTVAIYQPKVNKTYYKPITGEIRSLIEKSIAYTTERYGPCKYVFVNDKDSTKPFSYGTLCYRLRRMIIENNLRDDYGELFSVDTHLFRKTYGKRLCDMGLSDSVIAKLLGHSNTSSVKHYRRMTDTILAKETEAIRSAKDQKIKEYKGGW